MQADTAQRLLLEWWESQVSGESQVEEKGVLPEGRPAKSRRICFAQKSLDILAAPQRLRQGSTTHCCRQAPFSNWHLVVLEFLLKFLVSAIAQGSLLVGLPKGILRGPGGLSHVGRRIFRH